jgi:hypothetical protein
MKEIPDSIMIIYAAFLTPEKGDYLYQTIDQLEKGRETDVYFVTFSTDQWHCKFPLYPTEAYFNPPKTP